MQNWQPLHDNPLLKVLFLKLCMVPHIFFLITPQKLKETLAFCKVYLRITLIPFQLIWMKQDTDMNDDYKHCKDDFKHSHKTVGFPNPFFISAVSFFCLTLLNRTLWWQVLKGDIWTAAPTRNDNLTKKTTSPLALNSNAFHLRFAFPSSGWHLFSAAIWLQLIFLALLVIIALTRPVKLSHRKQIIHSRYFHCEPMWVSGSVKKVNPVSMPSDYFQRLKLQS